MLMIAVELAATTGTQPDTSIFRGATPSFDSVLVAVVICPLGQSQELGAGIRPSQFHATQSG
jgi:hypothetical protein